VTNPRAQLAMAEVHDCFTPTELILMEDLGFAERGTAWKEVLAGTFDITGELPVNPDGGLKSFGHPIGASGLRMMFECWLQLRRQAPGDRQIKSVTEGGRTLGLTHNLGGGPRRVCQLRRRGGIGTLGLNRARPVPGQAGVTSECRPITSGRRLGSARRA
jgi:acetyl-CoA acetyltransferase